MMGAVRLALAELGVGATSAQLQTHIRERFGHDMKLGKISNLKGKIRRGKGAGPTATAETAPPPAPATSTAPPAEVTMKEAVRLALSEAGRKAKTERLQSIVRARFGKEMTAKQIQTARRDLLREPVRQKPAAARAVSAPAAQAVPASTTGAGAVTPLGVSLPNIKATLALIEQVGAGQLKALIDILAR
jgi:hypothetical protein